MLNCQEQLEEMARRPAMYVGRCSLWDLGNYLSGYTAGYAQRHDGEDHPFAGFSFWVEMKFVICHPAWHWTRILLHEYGDDASAIAALPVLYHEFRLDVERLGFEELRLKKEKLFSRYRCGSVAPDLTDTTDPR